MKPWVIAVFILLSFSAQTEQGIAADKPAKAGKNEMRGPVQYDESALRLPAGYQGTDPKRFYELVKSSNEKLKKREFETTEEFVRRTADMDAILAPISTQKVYAFRVKSISPKYDADRQSYELLGVSGQYSCNPAGLGGTDRSTLVCKIANVMVVNDKYTGSNAYGASRVVERTIGTDLAVAIPNTPRIFGVLKDSGAIFDYSDRDGSVNLVDSLQMPIARAQAIRGDIGVLFVGNVTGPELIKGKALLIEPKIDHPRDMFFTTEALPFNLKRIVYYVVSTGDILAQRVFN